MSEGYNEFDTASIVSKRTVSVGRLSLRVTEVFLGILAIILLVIVIILAIVLSVKIGTCGSSAQIAAQTGSNPNSTDKPRSTEYPSSTDKPSPSSTDKPSPSSTDKPSSTEYPRSTDKPSSKPDFCDTAPCLKTAYYEKSIMNESADPCVNFYEFACGGYSSLYSPSQLIPDQTPFEQILSDNTQKLAYLLQYEPERYEEDSYERKLRHFFASCSNHFDKMELRGMPLISKVLIPFGKFNATTFSLHDMLKKVHIDFWTPAFFTLKLSTDSYDWNKKILEIDYGGVGLPVSVYSTPYYMKLYRSYIAKVTGFILRDAGAQMNDTLTNTFVNDTLEVESALANIAYSLPRQDDPHAVANRMTLGSLNSLTENTLDFVDYFKGQFPGLPFTFTEYTAVAVLRQGFFHKLGPLIKNYSSTEDGKRKLYNYLSWQLINRYSDYLSWDYVHAKRQFYYNAYLSKITSSGDDDCFAQALDTMKEAVGAVFVKDYVNQKDKQEATNIMNTIKEQMIEGLKNLEWMSSGNKDDAITKIRNGIYKIGYPDYMVDDNYMDGLYASVDISDTDYFGNVLSLNMVKRLRFRDVLAMPESKTMWAYHIVNPVVEYYNPWHELIATAAVFQYPLFAHNGPAYYNYGGMGTLLAANLFHAVDEYGSQYKLDKSNPGNWWTDFTQDHYLRIKECAINAQNGFKLGPFNITSFYQYTPNMTEEAFYFAPQLLAEASGLRLALKAYKSKLATTSTEKVPAGFTQYSLDKMFFVAYAQVHCHNTPAIYQFQKLVYNNDIPGEYRVNVAVSQVPEFKDAFACPKGAPMAAETTCQLF